VKVVTALTTSLIMPILGALIGKDAFAALSFEVAGVVFPIGVLVQSLIEFILVAFVLFLIIKGLNALRKKGPEVVAVTPEDIILLREIRDSLKK
jgi:large conductance mechanosensitive channel